MVGLFLSCFVLGLLDFERWIVGLFSFTLILRKKRILFKILHLWFPVGWVVPDFLETPEGSQQAWSKPQTSH